MIVFYPPDCPPLRLPGDDHSGDKKILVVQNLSPEVTSLHRIVTALRAHPDADALLVYTAGESSEWNYVESLYKIVTESFGIKHIALHDSGLNPGASPIGFIPSGLLLRLVRKDQPVVPAEHRTYHYSLLNRVPRAHRIKLVLELEQRNLLGLGAVSCGSSQQNYDYGWIVPQNKLNLFPMILDDIAHSTNPAKNEDGMYRYVADITAQQLSSAINIVSESCYDNIYGKNECWTRGMYTEKTSKCFLARQFPLFLAVRGYVDYLRHIGFDVFDDIIDHSYDWELDPLKRIERLANEVQRLASMPIDQLQGLLRANWHRLEANANNVEVVADRTDLVARQHWDIWLNSIKNS